MSRKPAAAVSGPAPVRYRIDLSGMSAHVYRVTVTVPKPLDTERLSLPVWIAGSYMVREFARHLSGLQARQGKAERPIRQLDKTTWSVDCLGGAALEVSYEVYAFDTSVRAAFLSADRGFFNNTSLCLKVHGREPHPHELSLRGLPRGWEVATAMPRKRAATRALEWEAADYDELVDHPFELGPFWRGRFKAQGVEHEFVVAGAWPGFDGQRLLRDVARICEEQIRFWHGTGGRPPFSRYVFMLHLVDEGYGGLEHRASTALIAARRDAPRVGDAGLSDGYLKLLGLVSHEYFHAWNVKRLKPVELCEIDHARENYSELLWFFEGFTSYYDDLALVRCGIIDGPRHLKLLARTASAVLATPGRRVQSLAQASWDAWNKYYRPDENTPNATVSYYAKGALLALCLDLTLRGQGRGTLDDVMRRLWGLGAERGAGKAGRDPGSIGIAESDIAQALEAVSGRPLVRELHRWVHGTDELPLPALLAAIGVEQALEEPRLSAAWGLRLSEGPVTGCVVRQVLRGSAAQAAGLSAGDEILAVQGWRVRRLDDAAQWLAQAPKPRRGRSPDNAVELLVNRDQRILRLQLQPGPPADGSASLNWAVSAKDPAGHPQATATRRAWWSPSR